MGVVVRRYIDILTIIINFPYSTCISSFLGSSIPTSLFILKMFFQSFIYRITTCSLPVGLPGTLEPCAAQSTASHTEIRCLG